MLRHPLPAILLTAALLGLGACAHDEEFAFARETVHAPACGAQPFEAVDGGSSIPGFGCASDAILRAMVVDPRDLEGGREMAAPTGDAALAAVRRHSAGEVKPPAPPAGSAIDTTVRRGN